MKKILLLFGVFMLAGAFAQAQSAHKFLRKGDKDYKEGNYSEAEKAFLYYKRKEKLPNGKKWVDIIAEDLKLLESKGMGNSDFDKIRTLLKIK